MRRRRPRKHRAGQQPCLANDPKGVQWCDLAAGDCIQGRVTRLTDRRLTVPLFLLGTLLFVCSQLFPATQSLQGDVRDEKGAPIAGAVCTLTDRVLSPRGLTVTTGEDGEFQFTGLVPSTYELTCAAVTYQPVVKGGLEVTESQAPTVDVVLPPEVIVREKVEIREKAPSVIPGRPCLDSRHRNWVDVSNASSGVPWSSPVIKRLGSYLSWA